VHIAALGGLWQAAVLGFAGLAPQEGGLAIEPHLPASWRSLRFRVQWRGREIVICLESTGRVAATLEAGDAFTLLVHGRPHEVRQGQPLRMHAGNK
jgi:trehalose/maltose hydrolase-like predicted phosphorylase